MTLYRRLVDIYEGIWPFTFRRILASMIDPNTRNILDIGCGTGRIFSDLNKHFHFEYACGIDIQISEVKKSRSRGVYDDCILADARHLPFRKGAFDTVLCLELIEHLPKQDGIAVLKDLKNYAQQQIVSTPSFFYPTKPPYGHQSFFSQKELQQYGYHVKGVRLKPFLGRKNHFLAKLARILLSPLTYAKPQFAACLIASKKNAQ